MYFAKLLRKATVHQCPRARAGVARPVSLEGFGVAQIASVQDIIHASIKFSSSMATGNLSLLEQLRILDTETTTALRRDGRHLALVERKLGFASFAEQLGFMLLNLPLHAVLDIVTNDAAITSKRFTRRKIAEQSIGFFKVLVMAGDGKGEETLHLEYGDRTLVIQDDLVLASVLEVRASNGPFECKLVGLEGKIIVVHFDSVVVKGLRIHLENILAHTEGGNLNGAEKVPNCRTDMQVKLLVTAHMVAMEHKKVTLSMEVKGLAVPFRDMGISFNGGLVHFAGIGDTIAVRVDIVVAFGTNVRVVTDTIIVVIIADSHRYSLRAKLTAQPKLKDKLISSRWRRVRH